LVISIFVGAPLYP